MAPKKRERKQYTAKQRKQILAAATKDNLTAEQVQKKFGVKPVTYYSWRKKTGITRSKKQRGRVPTITRSAPPVLSDPLDLRGTVRAQVHTRVQAMLPDIIRSEVSRYLENLFGHMRGKRAA